MGKLEMSDRLREFAERMARFVIPGDDDETMQSRVQEARTSSFYPEDEGDVDLEEIVMAEADDEFLCSETQAFWAMIRDARGLLKNFFLEPNAANCSKNG
jgi:hypothetical protein